MPRGRYKSDSTKRPRRLHHEPSHAGTVGLPDPDYSSAFSLLPNLVNLLVVDGRLVVGEPFYDGFKGELVARLAPLGYEQGSSLRFIDDWIVYHKRDGEIHCGTAVKRHSGRADWWIYVGQ